MDSQELFPALPEDLAALSDDELVSLLEEHDVALSKVEANDPEYLGDLGAAEIIAGTKTGVEQIKQIKAEQALREQAQKDYQAEIKNLAAEARADESAEETEDEGEGSEDEVAAEVVAEAEQIVAEAAEEEPAPAEEEVAVVASAPVFRRPPAPSRERQPVRVEESEPRAALVATAGLSGTRPGTELDALGLAKAMINEATRRGPVKHVRGGTEERIPVASAQFPFPAEFTLGQDLDANLDKLKGVGIPFFGNPETQKLARVASGGLCAPPTPFYNIPDFAVTDRPVRDSLPSYRAERGAVSVPSVTTIGDITTAISYITEAEDALGGTFATKSCQDLTCPSWTEVDVNIIAHCREYGNLGSRAWPEGIAHENNLTMAALARTAEAALLDRIKALSINVTDAAVYNATHTFVYAIVRAAAGIRYRLRLGADAPNLRALLPAWVPGLLVADQAAMQFDREKSFADVTGILRAAGIEPTYYLDTPSTGTSQGFADETASALDNFPTTAQWALFVDGEFLHIDGGTLELGIVRDSVLNSTNDYQVFGELFENVARIGPTQGALWVSSAVCPTGTFPALQTELSCG